MSDELSEHEDITALPDLIGEGEGEALTDWAKPPTVEELKQDLEDTKADTTTHVNDVNRWLDNLHIKGTAAIKKVDGHSSIQPKLIRKQAEWRYAALSEPFLSTEDIFNTAPVTYEDKKAAIQNGLVLNNQFNTQIQKVKFIDEFVRTGVDEGTIITRVGWDFTEEIQEVEVKDYQYQLSIDPEVMALLGDIHNMAQAEPQRFEQEVPDELKEAYRLSVQAGQPYAAIETGSHLEEITKITKNSPTVEICDYRNIHIDPTCMGNLSKARFIIYSYETSLAELKAAGKYHNLDKINADSNSILGDPDHASEGGSFNFADKARKKFVAYEYWGFRDVEGEGIVKPILATWVGDIMIQLEDNPYPDQELPFVAVQYLPVRRSIFGEPDGELLEDNQKIIGAVTRGMIDVIGRSANGQMGSRKDALDVTNKRKFDKGLDYEFNQSVNPAQAFHMHTFPEIPQSASLMLSMQNNEAESLTGVKAFTGGISGQALGDTATGIRSALDATSKRELGILQRLAEGIKQIGRKIISMNSEFLEEEEVIRVTNEEFVAIRRDDLAGKFDLSLSISTAEADEHKSQQLSFMLQTLGNNMDPGMTRIILTDIARLSKMPELAKELEAYEPTPDPVAQEKAQLELELLRAQIANENAKANENNANGILDEAKAVTEQARARQLGSDADLKDLDFIEQESGTQQERALEKMRTQTEGNLALKDKDGQNKLTEKLADINLGSATAK